MVQKRFVLAAGGLLFILGQILSGCAKVEYTCVSCHTDQATLEEVADAVPYPTSGGEG